MQGGKWLPKSKSETLLLKICCLICSWYYLFREKFEYLEITFFVSFVGTFFILGGKLQNDAKCEKMFKLSAL